MLILVVVTLVVVVLVSGTSSCDIGALLFMVVLLVLVAVIVRVMATLVCYMCCFIMVRVPIVFVLLLMALIVVKCEVHTLISVKTTVMPDAVQCSLIYRCFYTGCRHSARVFKLSLLVLTHLVAMLVMSAEARLNSVVEVLIAVEVVLLVALLVVHTTCCGLHGHLQVCMIFHFLFLK
jgi:hypothetical protein